MIKLVSLALVCGVIIIYLKSINSEIASLAVIASGIIILFYGFSYIFDTFKVLNDLVNQTGISNELYSIVFKITAIGYIIEFGAGTIEDMGLKNLSDKLVFAGKTVIVGMSMPIIYAIFNLLNKLTI